MDLDPGIKHAWYTASDAVGSMMCKDLTLLHRFCHND